MEKLISAIVLPSASIISRTYQGSGLHFPSEETTEGLPVAIPTTSKN